MKTQIYKYLFIVIIIFTGIYVALINSPIFGIEGAPGSWSDALELVLLSIILFIGVYRNKTWGYIATTVLGCFWIFVLFFNGFHSVFDYILLALNFGSILFLYQALKAKSVSN